MRGCDVVDRTAAVRRGDRSPELPETTEHIGTLEHLGTLEYIMKLCGGTAVWWCGGAMGGGAMGGGAAWPKERRRQGGLTGESCGGDDPESGFTLATSPPQNSAERFFRAIRD